MGKFKNSLIELSNYCKKEIKKKYKENIGERFYKLCVNDNDDINEITMFIITTDMFYKEIFSCANSYGDCEKDLLFDVYKKGNINILNFLLGLEFEQELFINKILLFSVFDNNIDLLKKILKKSVYCLGGQDYILYYNCKKILKEHENKEIEKMINEYFWFE